MAIIFNIYLKNKRTLAIFVKHSLSLDAAWKWLTEAPWAGQLNTWLCLNRVWKHGPLHGLQEARVTSVRRRQSSGLLIGGDTSWMMIHQNVRGSKSGISHSLSTPVLPRVSYGWLCPKCIPTTADYCSWRKILEGQSVDVQEVNRFLFRAPNTMLPSSWPLRTRANRAEPRIPIDVLQASNRCKKTY